MMRFFRRLPAGPGVVGATRAFLAGTLALSGWLAVWEKADRRALAEEALAGFSAASRDDTLVGRPCPQQAPAWHIAQLDRLARQQLAAEGPALLRLRYHAKWLGHLLQPSAADLAPTVSIVIPLYNRAQLAAEAVQSCFLQSWPHIEVVVVDDGSTDDVAAGLAPYLDSIVLLHKANGGVSSARNFGIAQATGDYVHFLDSDNLLDREAISAKLEAFRRVPDADIVYSRASVYDPLGPRVFVFDPPEPSGGPRCGTTRLLGAGYPAFTSTVMLPRWLMTTVEPFDERLRHSEDGRFWSVMALRDAKAVAVDRDLAERRKLDVSLSDFSRWWPISDEYVHARALAEILAAPRTWPAIFDCFERLWVSGRWERLERSSHPFVSACRTDLAGAVSAFGEPAKFPGCPTLLPVLLVRAGLSSVAERGNIECGSRGLYESLLAAATTATRTASLPSSDEIIAWRDIVETDPILQRHLRFLRRELEDDPRRNDLIPLLRKLLKHKEPQAKTAAARPARAELSVEGPAELEFLTRLSRCATWGRLTALAADGDSWARLAEAVAGHPAGEAPATSSDGLPPLAWRHATLKAAVAEGATLSPDNEATFRRVRNEAKWIGHAFWPGERAWIPTVGVMIPLTGDIASTRASVAAALVQTWTPTIVYVAHHEMSRDAEALAADTTRVRLVPRNGPSLPASRNGALRYCRGDLFLHLTPGDTPAPDTVARHVAAFAARPWIDASCAWPEADFGDGHLAVALAGGFNPPPGAVMLSSVMARQVGPFDDWLATEHVRRWWFRLAFAGGSLAPIEAPVIDIRPPQADATEAAIVSLLALEELFLHPVMAPVAFAVLAGMDDEARGIVEASADRRVERERSRLIHFAAAATPDGRNAALLTLMLAGLRTGPCPEAAGDGFHARFAATVAERLRACPPPAVADLAAIGAMRLPPRRRAELGAILAAPEPDWAAARAFGALASSLA